MGAFLDFKFDKDIGILRLGIFGDCSADHEIGVFTEMEDRIWRRLSGVMTSYLLFFNMHGYCKSRPSGQPPYYARNKSFPPL